MALCCVTATQAGQTEDTAAEILSASGVQGGLIVHLGCGDGTLTCALRANDRYLVQGLDADAANVAAARKHIQERGLYGPVSVMRLASKRLPYSNGLVNLLVAEEPGAVSKDEMMRVLAPGGAICIQDGDAWETTKKPWPKDIDEWTHDLHDAGGNPVASDREVGPPRHLQWTAGPRWARSHGWTPSVSAMVSARGRIFAICDETLTGVDASVPDQWRLVARDAFSGVVLWKRPVPNWGSSALSGTHDTGRGVSTGRFTMPPQLGKRLVAVGDTVYVTLGATAPVSALDAATGETRQVYKETANADEIICSDGRLIVTINPPPKARPSVTPKKKTPAPPPGKRVRAVETKTGRVLWTRGPFTGVRASRSQDPFGRLELVAGGGRVFVLTHQAIESLDAETGKTAWRIERPALPKEAVRRLGFAGIYEFRLTVMLYHDGIVLLAQPEPNIHHTYHTMPGTLYAFDAENGKQMWSHTYGGWGHCTQPDVFAIGDTVWTHVDAETEYGRVWGNGYRAKNPSKVNYRIQALDLASGELRKEVSTRDLFNVGHHHRCYRNRSTERFLLSSRRGVEFVDLNSGETQQHHWVRSGCLLGNLPCNGLLYVAPHPCSCYIRAKLTGFNALAPARGRPGSQPNPPAEEGEQLHRGPAYGNVPTEEAADAAADQWPTYRHDPQRSGATDAAVGVELAQAWQRDIGAEPSALVAADDKVLAAGVDAHTVHALDARDGSQIWSYTAEARVDSPPTVHQGLAIFGSADGRVYCLRAADGELVWRFQAAPRPRQVVAYGQLESPWPVPGSVLVHDDKCWFAAGRGSYLDGGICFYALDPVTGEIAKQETVYSADPETGKMKPVTRGHKMPGMLNDIPATDGSRVFIRQRKIAKSGGSRGHHLFSTAGYLDPSWFNRTYWRVGRARTTGLMVFDEDVAYGVEVYGPHTRNAMFHPGGKGYWLACMSVTERSERKGRRRGGGAKVLWSQRVPIRITAMTRAAETLFVAGSPDVVDPDDPHGAWEGRKGGILAAFSADEGKKLAQWTLPAPPAWDGLAAVPGRLLVALRNGEIACYERGE